jgi:hypothetical protein
MLNAGLHGNLEVLKVVGKNLEVLVKQSTVELWRETKLKNSFHDTDVGF